MLKFDFQEPVRPDDVNVGIAKKDKFLVLMPKNGTNRIGEFFFGNPRGWKRQHWSGEKETHVIFRDPLQKLYGSLAEITSHGIERGATLEEALDKIHTRFWEHPDFYDVHTESQVAYVHGITATHIHWLENGVSPVLAAIGYPGEPELKYNSSLEENRNSRTRLREEIVKCVDVEWVYHKYENDYKVFADLGRNYGR